jgi:Tfp pilus assembly protein FimT
VTLLEMIMVLAVLVAVAAMALPAMYGPMEDQRLRKTAELMRAQWTKARVTAMRTGQIHVFRYTVGGDTYAVEPWSGEVDSLEASADAGSTSRALNMPLSTTEGNVANLPLGVRGQRLPSGMTFFSGDTEIDARDSAVTDQGGMGGMDPHAATSIAFYPDGTTSDARVMLTNERCFVQVEMRGLTGMIYVSELMAAEELSSSGGVIP